MATLKNEQQMATQLACSRRHLINLRVRRLIPYVKLGRIVRYDPDAVARALEKLTVREVA